MPQSRPPKQQQDSPVSPRTPDQTTNTDTVRLREEVDTDTLRRREEDDTNTLRRREEIATHLANERTFIAWSFTGILIIGSGVALARTLIALNTSPLSPRSGRVPSIFYPTTLGLLFLAAGLLIIIMAACRYLSVQAQITHQRYRPSSTMVLIFLAIILGLCIVLAGFLLQLRGAL